MGKYMVIKIGNRRQDSMVKVFTGESAHQGSLADNRATSCAVQHIHNLSVKRVTKKPTFSR